METILKIVLVVIAAISISVLVHTVASPPVNHGISDAKSIIGY